MHFDLRAVAEAVFQQGELRAVERDDADVRGGHADGEEGFHELRAERRFEGVGDAGPRSGFVGGGQEGVGVDEGGAAGWGEEVAQPAGACGGVGADAG